jgi:outer membrane protein
MHLYRTRVFDGQEMTALDNSEKAGRRQAGGKAARSAALMLTLASCMPSGFAQQTPAGTNRAGQGGVRSAGGTGAGPYRAVFAAHVRARFFQALRGLSGNPINKYRPTTIGKASFANSVRLNDMVKDGKIYLSLSDAIALALENNYDIAIARYDLSIADTDILRTKTGAGAAGRAVRPDHQYAGRIVFDSELPAAVPVERRAARVARVPEVNGLSLTTGGAGPAPESLDPNLTATVSFDRDRALPPASSPAAPVRPTTTTSPKPGLRHRHEFPVRLQQYIRHQHQLVRQFSPQLSSTSRPLVTQHLLQGAGIWVNKRFMYQALNDRRIVRLLVPPADSLHRQPGGDHLLGPGAGL